MNHVILMGRLTKDPEFKEGKSVPFARYTLAVNRPNKKDETDFISCVVFGRGAEFANEYLKKGVKIAVAGTLQTGSYTNREGQKVYTTDVIVDRQEFAESVKQPAVS